MLIIEVFFFLFVSLFGVTNMPFSEKSSLLIYDSLVSLCKR